MMAQITHYSRFVRKLSSSSYTTSRMLPTIRCMSTQQNSHKNTNIRLLVGHILIKDKTKSDVLDELEKQLTAGAKFGDLARQHSECGSASRDGQLGWLMRGTYYPEFEEAAFSTTVGGFVRASTAQGLHLINVLDKKEEVAVQHISVQELSDSLANPALYEDMQFIDVREAWEKQTASLPHFKLYPLSKLQQWGSTVATELDPSKETVVLCHHGVRSMQAATFLVSQCGFTDVKNITGGIHAYSTEVDSSIPVY